MESSNPNCKVLANLERGEALSSAQAQLLLTSCQSLQDDWASGPFFRSIREHTRAYVDQLRAQERSIKAASDPTIPTSPKEPIHAP